MDSLHPLITLVGVESLTPAQIKKLNAWVLGHKEGDLLAMHVYPNVDTNGEIPSGVDMSYRMEAQVDPGALSNALFERVSVTPVSRGADQLTDEYFATKINALQETVPQKTKETINGKLRNTNTNMDTDHWESDMGGENSMIGIYSEFGDDLRTKSYHMVARGTAPEYVADFKRAVASLKPTYGELITNPEWINRIAYGINAASRNVHRNMAAAAEALGVNILRTDDHHAHASDDVLHTPEMAVPEWTQVTHVIRSDAMGTRPIVKVSHGVVPASDGGDEKFYVLGSPYDGIYAFPITRYSDLKAAGGLPVDTGRYVPRADIPTIDEKIYATRSKGITWEGRDKINADLHPDAFRPVNKNAMKKMGWNPEHHEGRLVPVCVKIYN